MKANTILFFIGVCSTQPYWNGYYYENSIGNDVEDLNKQLKTQGYKLIKIKKEKQNDS